MATHSAGRCHMCPNEFCDKTFTRPSKLLAHYRIHSNEFYHAQLTTEVKGMNFVSVFCDGATAVAVKEQEIIFLRSVHEEVITVRFLAIAATPRPTAQLIYDEVVQALRDTGMPDEARKHKLVGFDTDGAGVMQRPFKCTFDGCDQTYARAAHLKRHVQCSHPKLVASDIFMCSNEGCGQEFKNMQNLRRHTHRAHDLSRFPCPKEDCDMAFLKRIQLREHMAAHSLDQFKCDAMECDRTFQTKKDLVRHKKIHQGYHCTNDGCEESFPLWTLLRKHLAKEHVKIIPCPKCSKTFHAKSWMKQHLLIHEGTRDMYVCPETNCERSYFNKRNLNAHVRVYHGGNRFNCTHDGCERTFSTNQKLQLHGKLHDPNRPLPKKRKSQKGKLRVSIASRISGLPDKVGRVVRPVPVSGSNLAAFIGPGETAPTITNLQVAQLAQSDLSGSDSEWEFDEADDSDNTELDYEAELEGTSPHCANSAIIPKLTKSPQTSTATSGAGSLESVQIQIADPALDSTGHNMLDITGTPDPPEVESTGANNIGVSLGEKDCRGLAVPKVSSLSEGTCVNTMDASTPPSPYMRT